MNRRGLRNKLVPGFKVWTWFSPKEWEANWFDLLGLRYSLGHSRRRYVEGVVVKQISHSVWILRVGDRNLVTPWSRLTTVTYYGDPAAR